jgi:hypothetical protein
LVGRIVFTPEMNGAGPIYRFSGQVTLGRMLAGEILPRLATKPDALGAEQLSGSVEILRIIEPTPL